jgi:hypothetical protein
VVFISPLSLFSVSRTSTEDSGKNDQGCILKEAPVALETYLVLYYPAIAADKGIVEVELRANLFDRSQLEKMLPE